MSGLKSLFVYTITAIVALAAGFSISAAIFTTQGKELTENTLNIIEEKTEVFYGNLKHFQGKAFGWFEEERKNSLSKIAQDTDSFSKESDTETDSRQYITQETHLDALKGEKAVSANLEDMTMTLYENGKAIKKIEILSKGRPGSPWETPSGKYEVLYKKENHFSSIGEVYMPSSVQFFGNFFIHGWPYYPDGTPVSEGYSGGCIRLSTEDALEVYNFVDNGTPIIVHAESEADESLEDKSGYYVAEGSELKLNADSYVIADLETGEIIFEKARSQVRPIASLTKLMTALVSLEVVNQYQTARVSKEAVQTEGFAGGLVEGERIETGTLIYPLLLESSNDAAEVIARHYGRSHFMSQMNKRAESIGLTSTFFEDPSGLSERNISSATELFTLVQYIYKNKKHIFNVTKLDKHKADGHLWTSNSKFIEMEGFLGSKNGFTDEAGKTQIALFSLPLAEFEDRDIAVILLSSSDVVYDTKQVVDFLIKNVSYRSESKTVLDL